MATATCHTSGCGNAEIPIPDVPTEWTDPDGETQPVSGVVCGVCGNPIDDVQD